MDWFIALVPIGLFFYLPLQISAVLKLKGFWRLFALIPLLPMGYVLIVTAVAISEGSNLAPMLFLFTVPFALVYVVVLVVLHWIIVGKT